MNYGSHLIGDSTRRQQQWWLCPLDSTRLWMWISAVDTGAGCMPLLRGDEMTIAVMKRIINRSRVPRVTRSRVLHHVFTRDTDTALHHSPGRGGAEQRRPKQQSHYDVFCIPFPGFVIIQPPPLGGYQVDFLSRGGQFVSLLMFMHNSRDN